MGRGGEKDGDEHTTSMKFRHKTNANNTNNTNEVSYFQEIGNGAIQLNNTRKGYIHTDNLFLFTTEVKYLK